METICPTCNGKGHVLDKEVLVFVPVISWLFAAVETNDKHGITRQRCETCKGTGVMKR